jgi:hypothetical protein
LREELETMSATAGGTKKTAAKVDVDTGIAARL